MQKITMQPLQIGLDSFVPYFSSKLLSADAKAITVSKIFSNVYADTLEYHIDRQRHFIIECQCKQIYLTNIAISNLVQFNMCISSLKSYQRANLAPKL